MTRTWPIAIACVLAAVANVSSDGPSSSEEYWLQQAQPATSPATDQPARAENTTRPLSNPDAVPGAIRLSDGRILKGTLFTTPETFWELYLEESRQWRRIPFPAVLEITAEVTQETDSPKWRWKATGVGEKVYTGQTAPTRRLQWRFRLADGTMLLGTIKGQPLWVQTAQGRQGPFLLHERQQGRPGQTHESLIYPEQIVVSPFPSGKAASSDIP